MTALDHVLDALPDQEWECIIVGGGAGGLSAALVLGRARRRVLVVDAGEPLNAPAPHMQGYLSRDGTPPLELLRIGRGELEAYGVPVVAARVAALERDAGPSRPRFAVLTEEGRRVRARRIVLAHGMGLALPELPGLREVWGDTAANCPYCHGWEVRNRPIAVLGVPAQPGATPGIPGPGARAVHLGMLVTQWSADVLLCANGVEIDAAGEARLRARDVRIDPRPVERLAVRDGQLAGIVFAGDDEVVPREALFVAAAPVPRTTLLTQLGATLLETGWPQVDSTGKTTVPGVWAVGQAANPMLQVIHAAASGSMAAAAINADLLEEAIVTSLAAAAAPQPAATG